MGAAHLRAAKRHGVSTATDLDEHAGRVQGRTDASLPDAHAAVFAQVGSKQSVPCMQVDAAAISGREHASGTQPPSPDVSTRAERQR